VKCNGLLPVLSITEPVKTATSTTYFRKKAGVEQAPVIRLSVQENGAAYRDEMAFRLFSDGKLAWDTEYDAYKLEDPHSPAPYIASVLNDTTDLSVNTLPQLAQGEPIPLRIKVKKTGNYLIGIERNGDIPAENCLVLEDLENGNYTDLKTDSSYSFSISDTVVAPRFLIHNRPEIDLGPDRVLASGGQLLLKAPAGYLKYSWSNGASTPAITATDTGWYRVTVQNKAGCQASDSIHISSDPTVHNTEPAPQRPALTLFPNPANNFTHLMFDEVANESFSIQLYTPDGQLVTSTTAKASTNHNRIKLNLNSLSTGSYLLKVTGTSNHWVKRLQIAR
jgi:hypothetical protein